MTRKKLTLPSGATCVIRKLTVSDFALHAGYIPQAFADAAKEGRRPTVKTDDTKQLADMVKASHIILLECVSPLSFPDGQRLRIVDKAMDKAADDEITVGELEQADAETIINEVTAMTSLTKEAAVKAKPFPAEQEAASEHPPVGEALRLPAIGSVKAAG